MLLPRGVFASRSFARLRAVLLALNYASPNTIYSIVPRYVRVRKSTTRETYPHGQGLVKSHAMPPSVLDCPIALALEEQAISLGNHMVFAGN